MNFARRKQLYVNSQIQGSLLRRVAAFWLMYHLALWLFLFAVYFVRDQSAFSLAASFREYSRSHSPLLMVAVAVLPIVLWRLLCFSHRVAGPLVQLRNRLQNMAAGTPPEKMAIRKDDLLTEIETAFNQYVEFLKTRSAEGRDSADRADQTDSAMQLLDDVEQLASDLSESIEIPESDRQEPVAASQE